MGSRGILGKDFGEGRFGETGGALVINYLVSQPFGG